MDAKTRFLEALVSIAGISKQEAQKVYNTYNKLKVLDIDVHIGQITVKHGAFLDADVIKRAVNF